MKQIHKKIIKNDKVDCSDFIYDRQVHLLMNNTIKCVANSMVYITDQKMIELIQGERVGIGQLFRYLNVLPEFTLTKVAKNHHSFSREYSLISDGIRCDIKETFPLDLFDNNEKNGELDLGMVNNTSVYHAPH